ncbi:MAG: type II secretion system F family protein [Alphaproteobacteria bacterium]|nr:type II secretion system F family protein [Alphaproteobacteria bacterium]
MQIVLIATIVFLVVGIGMFLMMNAGSAKKQKDSIAIIRGRAGAEVKVQNEKDVSNKRRAEIAKKLKDNKEEENKDKKKLTMAVRLLQAGLKISPKQFYLFSILLGVLLVALAKIMHTSLLVMILFGIIGFLGLPRFVLRKLTQRRQKKFLSEFADALEAMIRLLKAGMPVSEAVSMISREFDGPVGEEMSIIYDKQKIGIPLHEAALEATRRMPITEMQMFATGLAIQAQTGSSLSEVLGNLAGVIRARFRLKRKILALSSEAIASASIIGALPPLVAFGLWCVNPGYIEVLFTTPTGKYMLFGAVCWMSIGVLVMKQMINFKI